MTTQSSYLATQVYDYLRQVGYHEPPALKQIRLASAELKQGHMQIAPEQGQFLALLVQLLQAKKILELGVFTGYSTAWLAQHLPEDGKLLACEINEQWAQYALENWRRAGLDHKIDLQLAPASETLAKLLQQGQQATFDLIFIDADKQNQQQYYTAALQLLRVGGLVVVDNVLWQGKVADAQHTDKTTQAIRALNSSVHRDPRVDISLLPIGDGLLLARKK